MVQCSKNCPVLGVILAGGQSRRFEGGDKAFQILAGRDLIHRVADRVRPQVTELIVNTNDDPSKYRDLGASAIIADDVSGYQGPLAGLAAAIRWLENRQSDIAWSATFPVDCPFLPENLVETLMPVAMANDVPVAASCLGRVHAVVGVWPVGIERSLRDYLAEDKRGPVQEFLVSQKGIIVEFPERSPDPFFNINTREDLLRAEKLALEVDRLG